ncbi:MAG: ABC transporter substrate-binding protein [Ktedonobacterales bacterium]
MGIGQSRSKLTAWIVSTSSLVTVVILLGTLAGCGGTSTPASLGTEKPLLAKDADGTTIVIPKKAPQRIISLEASDSEILGALDMASRVIAVDGSTDYPADMASKPKISDSSGNYDVEAIVADQPDLVLSSGGLTRSVDAQLEAVHITVVDLPELDLTGTLLEIRLVGQLVHAESAANQLVASLEQRIAAVKAKVAGATPVSVYMEVYYSAPTAYVFGGTSFGDELIRDAGGTNVFGDDSANAGYPNVDEESIIAANPQVIILTEDAADGGIPALVYQRPGWSVISAVKSHRVYALNTDESERPGPRLVDALEQLAMLLHPDRFS